MAKHYRPGLIFKAGERSFGHQEFCRSEKKVYAVDGTVIDVIPALVAEFAAVGPEYDYVRPDGETDKAATRWGGFFDLDEQAAVKGWGDEEKEIVARHMLRQVERRTPDFSLYSKPKLDPPWPTYDEMDAEGVVSLAEAAGHVGEALAYEKENQARSGVIKPLEAILEKLAEEAKTEEAFVAA